MKIELLGWRSEGLRSPDIEVNLRRSDGSVPRTSLIQMPNGTGKTTTLSCLRAAMDGSAETWSTEKVRSFRDREKEVSQGTFVAELLVNGEQKITVEMTFHFEDGAVTYQTLVGSDSHANYSPPPEVRRYLDPRFSELLFFDGETANRLLDGESTTSASQIIDTFYGLYHITDLKEEARKHYQLFEQRSGPAKGAAEAAKLAKRRDRMQEKAESLRKQADKDQARLTHLKERQAKLESDLEEHLRRSEQFQEEEIRAGEARDEASERLRQGFHELDKVFPDPWAIWPPLADRARELVKGLDEVKLIERPPRLYLEELAKSEFCVCDRPMDEAASAAVRAKASDSLDDAVTGFLKSLKRDVVTSEKRSGNLFQKAVDEISSADDELTAAQQSLKGIRNRAAESGDEEVSRKKDELQRLEDEIGALDASVKEALRPTRHGDTEGCGCIDYFVKRTKTLEDDLAKLSGTRDWKHRTDTLLEVLEEAYADAHSILKDDVIMRANDRLRQILSYNPVQIEDIDSSVVLKGRKGASVGQTLAVGYVFLAGLLHEGGNQFPLVVDSPVGSLDDEARKELGGLLPILTKQMVGFVIASERQWFVDKLEEASDDGVFFLTHLRINDYTKEIIAGLKGDRRSESSSGVLIEGREAFMALGEDVEESE